jgi:hypothetical protein
MGFFKSIGKAITDTALLPIDMARDAVHYVADEDDDYESATLRRVKKIDQDFEETLEDDDEF